jgi:cell pole-organizing protein PopZ
VNTPNPSSSEKDLESLRDAQRAHESSMDEILASIRSIIAEDREPSAANARAPRSPGGPQIVYSNDFAPLARVAAIALEAPTPLPESPAEIVSLVPRIAREFQPPASEPATPLTVEPRSEPDEDEAVASSTTQAAVAASFSALSASVALQESQMIERVVREMLRPMLKSWLDDNLPALVERLVRTEIQRVARGGR